MSSSIGVLLVERRPQAQLRCGDGIFSSQRISPTARRLYSVRKFDPDDGLEGQERRMQVLGQFPGSGILTIKGIDTPVEYNIPVWGDQSRRRADGVIHAPIDVLDTAFGANGLKLRLKTGEQVEIVVTSVDMAEGSSAEIAVNSPMPGF